MSALRLLAAVIGVALLGGCSALSDSFAKPAHDRPEPVINRPSADAEAARDYLAALQALQSAQPATQA